MRALLSGLVVVILAAPVPALAADTTVAPLGAPTAIRSYAGWSAWMRLDPGTQRYVMQVRSPTGVLTTRPESVAVPDPLNPDSAASVFDLGPDTAGRPAIALAACADGSCGVDVGRLPAGATSRVRGTELPEQATSVALWRGSVAFVTSEDDVWLARSGSRVAGPGRDACPPATAGQGPSARCAIVQRRLRFTAPRPRR